jgi:hypothetical protein
MLERWFPWIKIGTSFTLHAVEPLIGTLRAFVCAFAMWACHGAGRSPLEVSIGPLAHRLDPNRSRNLPSSMPSTLFVCIEFVLCD